MEDGKEAAGAVIALAAAPSLLPPDHLKEAAIQRQRFTVELRPSETTIISWKKLLKESGKGTGPSADLPVADPVLASTAGPVQHAEGEPKDAVPLPSRFNAVIEKIERLYMGKQSSDEELDDNPDDDQYDTKDSFIDDVELNEYFQVDKLATKHNGYFVNRGKLEGIELSSSPNQAPKKRKRKDPTKVQSEEDNEHISSKLLNMGIKAASRTAPFAKKKLSSTKILINYGAQYQEGKHLKSKLNAPRGTYKRKSADFSIISENAPALKMSNKDALSLSSESKELDKHKTGVLSSWDLAHKLRGTRESLDDLYQDSRDKCVSSHIDSQPRKLSISEKCRKISSKIRCEEIYEVSELPDLNSPGNVYPMQAAQPSAMPKTEGSTVRSKDTTLERAIRDLEKIAEESRLPNLDSQEVDASSQGIKRRLPKDIKQKLAKVARLSVGHGKLSEDELMDRLMGILGHIVQRTTLKRHLKEMLGLGLSAKQEKSDRFQKIKKEVHEMIKTNALLIRSKVPDQQDGSADDFQDVTNNDEKRAIKGRSSIDKSLEDKICDLYDLYVEGTGADKGPQSRKFYVQLVEMWPKGCMDSIGIIDAIYRSKQRKVAPYRKNKVRHEERLKWKRLASSNRVEETTPSAQVRAGQERPASGSIS